MRLTVTTLFSTNGTTLKKHRRVSRERRSHDHPWWPDLRANARRRRGGPPQEQADRKRVAGLHHRSVDRVERQRGGRPGDEGEPAQIERRRAAARRSFDRVQRASPHRGRGDAKTRRHHGGLADDGLRERRGRGVDATMRFAAFVAPMFRAPPSHRRSRGRAGPRRRSHASPQRATAVPRPGSAHRGGDLRGRSSKRTSGARPSTRSSRSARTVDGESPEPRLTPGARSRIRRPPASPSLQTSRTE